MKKIALTALALATLSVNSFAANQNENADASIALSYYRPVVMQLIPHSSDAILKVINNQLQYDMDFYVSSNALGDQPYQIKAKRVLLRAKGSDEKMYLNSTVISAQNEDASIELTGDMWVEDDLLTTNYDYPPEESNLTIKMALSVDATRDLVPGTKYSGTAEYVVRAK